MWPQYDQKDHYQVMHLSPTPKAKADRQRKQFELLDKLSRERHEAKSGE
jgi:hypothetical protein